MPSLERLENHAGPAAEAGRLRLRPRQGARLDRRAEDDRARRRLHRRGARHRARRARRRHPRQRGAHDRLSHHRGGGDLDQPRRRQGGRRPSARLRPGDRLRAGAGARASSTCPRCRSASQRAAELGSRVVMAGSGGRHHSLATRIVAKQEFAGYWEYVLDEAIFTAPAHPFWGGAALIDAAGSLIGIGSLQVEQRAQSGDAGQLNMIVPIDLLKPILDDLLTTRPRRAGRRAPGSASSRPTSREKCSSSASIPDAPADRAGLKPGDLIVSVGGEPVVEPRRFLPQGLVARAGRRRSAARRPARGRDASRRASPRATATSS